MPTIEQVATYLSAFAPLRLAEEWDNVGLLVGHRQAAAERVMTCLTITRESVAEAIARKAQLIVTHHPLPFRPLKKITSDTVPGQLLLDLIGNRIAVYSPHTAFDSAARGINQQLADALQLQQVIPLIPVEEDPDSLGAGRYGQLAEAQPLAEVAAVLKRFLAIEHARVVGAPERKIRKIAVACGSGSSFLAAANRHACDLLVTGEAPFHTCLEACAFEMSLLLLGHFASERFACERLAEALQAEFAAAEVWVSEHEADPLHLI